MIDAEIGGSQTNSYVTLAQAEAYFADRVGAEAWAAADAAGKERALLSAARALERLRWPGRRRAATQALAWPRVEVSFAAEGEIPRPIRDAQCEEALALLTPGLARRHQLRAAGVTRARVMASDEQYLPGEAALVSMEARALLRGWIAVGGRIVREG